MVLVAENKILTTDFFSLQLTEGTGGGISAPRNVGKTPWCPKMIHYGSMSYFNFLTRPKIKYSFC